MKNKTDKAVFAVTGTTFLTFLMARHIGTIWILYPNVLIAVFLFVYCIWRVDADASLLSNSTIFGIATTVTYVPMDWLFSRKARLIFYLRSGVLANLTTPIGIILSWIVFATLAAYCYQRLTAIFRTRFASETGTRRIGFTGIAMLAAGVTGIGAAVGSNIIYAFGESHLWLWNATQVDHIPQIASVPGFCTGFFSGYFSVVSLLFRCGWWLPEGAARGCGWDTMRYLYGGTAVLQFSSVLCLEIVVS